MSTPMTYKMPLFIIEIQMKMKLRPWENSEGNLKASAQLFFKEKMNLKERL